MTLKEKKETVMIPDAEGWYFLKTKPSSAWKPYYVDKDGYCNAITSHQGHVDGTPFGWLWSERIPLPNENKDT